MAEIDRDKLTGTTVEKRDQEGYRAQKIGLDNYVMEREGILDPEVIIDVETLESYSVPRTSVGNQVVDLKHDDKIVKIADLKHNDSRLGKLIRKNLLEKKAA